MRHHHFAGPRPEIKAVWRPPATSPATVSASSCSGRGVIHSRVAKPSHHRAPLYATRMQYSSGPSHDSSCRRAR